MRSEEQAERVNAQTGASFHEMLRNCRLAVGLTQEALAERAGISTRNIRALEAGANKPQRETAAAPRHRARTDRSASRSVPRRGDP